MVARQHNHSLPLGCSVLRGRSATVHVSPSTPSHTLFVMKYSVFGKYCTNVLELCSSSIFPYLSDGGSVSRRFIDAKTVSQQMQAGWKQSHS